MCVTDRAAVLYGHEDVDDCREARGDTAVTRTRRQLARRNPIKGYVFTVYIDDDGLFTFSKSIGGKDLYEKKAKLNAVDLYSLFVADPDFRGQVMVSSSVNFPEEFGIRSVNTAAVLDSALAMYNKRGRPNPIEFPVVERAPDHFRMYTGGSYFTADAARRAARKQAQFTTQHVVIVHEIDPFGTQSWLVGYVPEGARRNPIEFPVVERAPDHFTTYTRGSYLSATAAQRAARKQAKLGGQPIILHEVDRMRGEYWLVGYVPQENPLTTTTKIVILGVTVVALTLVTRAWIDYELQTVTSTATAQ